MMADANKKIGEVTKAVSDKDGELKAAGEQIAKMKAAVTDKKEGDAKKAQDATKAKKEADEAKAGAEIEKQK